MIAILLATIAVIRIVWRAGLGTHVDARPAQAPRMDISNIEERDALLRYALQSSGIWSSTLLRDCGRFDTGDNVYRVEAFTAFRRPASQFVELRASGSSATSIRYEVPSRAPPPGSNHPPLPPEPPVAREVSRETFERVADAAEQLWRDGVPLARSVDVMDGNAVYLEFCRGGKYGFFARRPVVNDGQGDLRLVELANLILATAGEQPIAADTGLTP